MKGERIGKNSSLLLRVETLVESICMYLAMFRLNQISTLTLVLTSIGKQVASIEERCDYAVFTTPCGSGCIRDDALSRGGVACVNDKCVLAEPLDDVFQTLIDIGQITAESLLSDSCLSASNQCGETLFDPNLNKCENGEVMQHQYACSASSDDYCSIDSLCDKDGMCWPQALVCTDEDIICGPQSEDLYDVFVDGGTVSSGTLEDICGSPCEGSEPTPAPGPEPTTKEPTTAPGSEPTTSVASKGIEISRMVALVVSAVYIGFANM